MNSESIQVIKELGVAKEVCKSLLLRETIIGLDCEGVDLGLNGQVTLVQIASSDRHVYLFDVLTCPEIATGALKEVLESPTIVKVIHDCRADRVNLLKDFGIVLAPVFDTQIAYKFANPRTMYRIGWNKLCENYGLKQNGLKFKFHQQYLSDKSFWKRRPLTPDMIQYAAADVQHLHYLYDRLNCKIPHCKRQEFVTACRDATIRKGEIPSRNF